MNRLLLLALTAGLLSPIAAKAEPIPGISDIKVDFSSPIRINFDCPTKDVSIIEDGFKKKESKALYQKCWVDFHSQHINIMDRQVIKKKEVINSWRSYNYSSIGINRSWHITYKDKNDIAVFSLNRRAINSQGKSKKESKRVDLIINTWMAQ